MNRNLLPTASALTRLALSVALAGAAALAAQGAAHADDASADTIRTGGIEAAEAVESDLLEMPETDAVLDGGEPAAAAAGQADEAAQAAGVPADDAPASDARNPSGTAADCIAMSDVYAVDAVTGYRASTFVSGRSFYIKTVLSNSCGSAYQRYVKFVTRPYGCWSCTWQVLDAGTVAVPGYTTMRVTSTKSFWFSTASARGYHDLQAEAYFIEPYGLVFDEGRVTQLYHPY
ncbi:hypothetical protein DCC79_03745 [bacterium]|nr:MAG: hypothetical protein DCC79_03745 [bacterium]